MTIGQSSSGGMLSTSGGSDTTPLQGFSAVKPKTLDNFEGKEGTAPTKPPTDPAAIKNKSIEAVVVDGDGNDAGDGESSRDQRPGRGESERANIPRKPLEHVSKLEKQLHLLQKKLARMERETGMIGGLEELEAEWDEAAQELGSDEEAHQWDQRMKENHRQSMQRTKEMFEEGARWIARMTDSVKYRSEEERTHTRSLLEARREWETKRRMYPRTYLEQRLSGQQTGYYHTACDLSAPYDNPEALRGEFELRRDLLEREYEFNKRNLGMEFEARDRWARHHKRTTYEHLPQPEVVAQPSKPTSTLEEKILKRAERPKPQPLAVGYAVPELKWVEWADFRELQRAPEKDSFAIDVLIGHPIIRDYSSRYQIAEVAQDGLQGGNKQQLPGQAPLPERIRIHSRPIRQILKKIHGSDFGPADKAIILIRPFRVLVYYQTQLLAWRDDLASEFPPQTPAESDIKPGNRTEKADGQAEAKSESGANGAGSEKDGAAAPQNENQTEKDGKKGVEESDADTRSPVALQHLQCLLEFMTGHIGMRLSHLESDSCRKITFSDIWHLFKPGDFVIEKEGRQAYRVISVASTGHKVSEPWPIYLERSKPKAEVEQTFIKILCVYIDFDGEHLGPVKKEFTIKMFDEEKPVKSLDIYPFHFSAERNLREELVKRGKIFFDAVVTKHTHKHYAGPTLVTKDEVDSQVVIDFSETLAIADHKDWRPKIEDMIDVTATRLKAKACEAECCRGESVHDDSYVERKRDESFMAGLIPPTWRHSKLPSVAVFRRTFQDLQAGESSNISDDELVIMSYRVFGFVLRSRQWARLDITYLKHVNAQDEEIQRDGKHKGAAPAKEIPALDQLILPGNHKDILVSLISQHFRDKGSKVVDGDQADFVRGKGKGLIILLHGAPGVGKTTTAECMAEKFQKPLYQITCGDLGTTAKDVESALGKSFALANKWDCILLLDEADVFLARRTNKDYKRNGLVAVFLRVLEYYAGVLFLTTNRVGDFDEAFKSRIHISLHYPPLGIESALDVFQVNFDRLRVRTKKRGRDLTIKEMEITRYVQSYWNENKEARWNGRQIRNACQTALALAEFEAQGNDSNSVKDPSANIPLGEKHFKTVGNAYLKFTEYLKDIHGVYDQQDAKDRGYRGLDLDDDDLGGVAEVNVLVDPPKNSRV